MIYGYARVSTAGQGRDGNSLEDQAKQLRSAGAQEVYSESFTGMKVQRPEFDKVISLLKEGDTLVVCKLDRFARNASDGYNVIKGLLDKGVKVHILNMGLIEDTPMGRLMMHVMFAFAEFERDMIVERTQAGKAVAKQNPEFKEGRPGISADIVSQIQAGVPYTELGISQRTWYRYRKAVS
jgi:DNA invertase Pin-like site-specific DNA recombinase